MPEILWKASPPSAKKLQQPEGPPGWYLDAYAANDLELARRIWTKYSGAINRVEEIDKRAWLSSWNWWPEALATRILAASDRGDKSEQAHLVEALTRYCHRQLNRLSPKQDLWGAETLSRLYNWPAAVMSLLHDWAKQNNVEAALPPLTDLLRAHAYTLTLLSLPDPYPGSETKELYVCAPGMRSHQFQQGQILSFIAACMLNAKGVRERPQALAKAAKPGVSVLWPSRVAWRARHEYLTEPERAMLRRHVENGTEAGEIVKVLNELGVELRTPVQVWRYQNGEYTAFARTNVQGSTPPIMAMSRVNGQYHHLDVHPHGFRGEGHRRLGSPSKCWREADHVRVIFKNAVLGRHAPPKDLEGSIPAPMEEGKLLYAARIGSQGPGTGGVWLMTEETRAQELEARRLRIVANATRIGELSADKPDQGVFGHGQAIGRLVQGPTTDMIFQRARAITRIGAKRPAEEEVVGLARHINEIGEWWS